MHIVFVFCSDDDPDEYGDYLLRLLAKPGEYSCRLWEAATYGGAKKEYSGHDCILLEVKRKSVAGIALWLRLRLPGLLKKFAADVVIFSNGFTLSYIQQPQVMLVPAGGYMEKGAAPKKGWQHFSKKNIRASMKTAAAVFSLTKEALPFLESAAGMINTNAHVIPYSADEIFTPLPWHDRTITKASHTGNKDFFAALITSKVQDYIQLLKAFSGFKKWQQSSMQLLLIISGNVSADEIQEKLASYKYRSDVKLIDYEDERQTAGLMASAYAMLFNNTEEHLLPVVQALQCGVPVISCKDPLVEAYAANAVLFTADNTPGALADQMIYLYKNETLRETLSAKGLEASKLNSITKQQHILWSILASVVQQQ